LLPLLLLRIYPQQSWPAQIYVTLLLAGRIENWRIGAGGDDLRASPYYTKQANPPPFNKLFAALYDFIFSKMTNMGYMIPSPTRSLKDIFKEKIHGTDKFLVSAELIGYLKWVIYIALFKDRSNVEHLSFYDKEVAYLNHPGNERWRSMLYSALKAWYDEFKPTKKRKSRHSNIGGGAKVVIDADRGLLSSVDGFADELADESAEEDARPAAGVALAAAAAAAAAGGSGS
jgi:hypothetical protein